MAYPPPALPHGVATEPMFQDFLDHWHGLRGDTLLPERQRLSLIDDTDFILSLAIFEYRGHGNIRYWFIGPRRSALATDEMSGDNLATLLPTALGQLLKLEAEAAQARPFGRVARIHGSVDSAPCLAETLVLPLADINGKPRFMASLMRLSPRPDGLIAMRPFFASAERLEILTFDIGAGVPVARYEATVAP